MLNASICSSLVACSTTTPGWSNALGVSKVFDNVADTEEGVVEEEDVEDVEDDAEEELDERRVGMGPGIALFAASLLLTSSYCCTFSISSGASHVSSISIGLPPGWGISTRPSKDGVVVGAASTFMSSVPVTEYTPEFDAHASDMFNGSRSGVDR